MIKIFKIINDPNIKDFYVINEFGIIKNLQNDKILKSRIDKYGYKIISLQCNDNLKRRTFKVHRLVCITFKPISYNKYNQLTVNHINGNKIDNYIDNLEWMTTKDNIRHSIKNNLRSLITHNKIKENEVIEICKLLEKGYHPKMIAELLHPNQEKEYIKIIQGIKNHEHWNIISSNYNIDCQYKYKNFRSSYSIFDIEKICELISLKKFTTKEISYKVFNKYNHKLRDLIVNIKEKRKYINVSKYYDI